MLHFQSFIRHYYHFRRIVFSTSSFRSIFVYYALIIIKSKMNSVCVCVCVSTLFVDGFAGSKIQVLWICRISETERSLKVVFLVSAHSIDRHAENISIKRDQQSTNVSSIFADKYGKIRLAARKLLPKLATESKWSIHQFCWYCCELYRTAQSAFSLATVARIISVRNKVMFIFITVCGTSQCTLFVLCHLFCRTYRPLTHLAAIILFLHFTFCERGTHITNTHIKLRSVTSIYHIYLVIMWCVLVLIVWE